MNVTAPKRPVISSEFEKNEIPSLDKKTKWSGGNRRPLRTLNGQTALNAMTLSVSQLDIRRSLSASSRSPLEYGKIGS
jgi:hypothetical protein